MSTIQKPLLILQYTFFHFFLWNFLCSSDHIIYAIYNSGLSKLSPLSFKPIVLIFHVNFLLKYMLYAVKSTNLKYMAQWIFTCVQRCDDHPDQYLEHSSHPKRYLWIPVSVVLPSPYLTDHSGLVLPAFELQDNSYGMSSSAFSSLRSGNVCSIHPRRVYQWFYL